MAMNRNTLLRQCQDALLGLSDPDLFLLMQQWIETTGAIEKDRSHTVEEDIENLLCIHLGYTIWMVSRRTPQGRRYESYAAFIHELDLSDLTVDHRLCPPPSQELRSRLAALSLHDFDRIVIAFASADTNPNAPSREFLLELTDAIRENRVLDRGRPECLFYCIGYRLGCGLAGSSLSEQEQTDLLTQVWQNTVTRLLLRLMLYLETEDMLVSVWFRYAALGLRDGRDCITTNPALEVVLLLYKQMPELDQFVPAGAPLTERQAEQALRRLLWDESPSRLGRLY